MLIYSFLVVMPDHLLESLPALLQLLSFGGVLREAKNERH